MKTNTEFAMTVAVVVPVILLALGAEARTLDERTRQRRDSWLQMTRSFDEVAAFLEGLPDYSPDWTDDQAQSQRARYHEWQAQRRSLPIPIAYLTTLLWAATIATLTVTEVGTLVWLTGEHPASGDAHVLAVLSVVAVAAGMALLIVGPALRLLWFNVVPSVRELQEHLARQHALKARKFGNTERAD